MKNPRSRFLVVPAFVLLSFGLVACGGGGGGSAGGATTSPLLTAEVMQPAFDGRVFGSAVPIRVRTQAPEAAVRINGSFAIPDAGKTTWTTSLPALPGPLDVDVEILAEDGSVREKGIARRLEVHEIDVRKLEWYEPDATHSRLRALARRRDDSLVFVEYDLVAGGMKIVRTDAGQEVVLGTVVAPFTWDSLRDVVYDVQNEVQGAPVQVRRIDVATGISTTIAISDDPGDSTVSVVSLRYDHLDDSLLLHANAMIGGNLVLTFRRIPAGQGLPTELPLASSPPYFGAIGVSGTPGGTLTLSSNGSGPTYHVVDPTNGTSTAQSQVFVPGTFSGYLCPVQPDFALPGAILNLRQTGLFVDQPSISTSTLLAPVSPINSPRPIHVSPQNGTVLLHTGQGPTLVDRFSGTSSPVPTVERGVYPDFLNFVFAGFRLEDELVGVYDGPLEAATFRVIRHDPESSMTTEIPVTGLDFPDGSLIQAHIVRQIWDPDAGRLIGILATWELFSLVSIELVSVDIETGEAMILATSDETGPSGLPVHVLHDRARGRYLVVTATGDIYGYEVQGGSLGLVAQLPEPTAVFPYSTPGYAVSIDEAADCAYFLQSSYIGAATVVAKVDLDTGAVTTTTIDYGAALPGEYQWVSGASPDRSGRVLIAARRTTTLLTDLLRLDLATGNVELVDIKLRPNQPVFLWPDESDLDRPILDFEGSIYSADFLSGGLTLLAR